MKAFSPTNTNSWSPASELNNPKRARTARPRVMRALMRANKTNGGLPMNEITTTDLSKFGSREKAMAAELLTAMSNHGLPDDFNDDETTVMMNMNSGNVFLTNSDCQVAMMNGDKLESFYSCPECGHEGFFEEMEHDGSGECMRYYREIKKAQVA